MMGQDSSSVLVKGFAHLVVSQVSTRLITFVLNLITARLLTVDAYGLSSVQFHLVNTTILFLSREGFRRGCLRGQQSSTNAILRTAALCIPFGLAVTAAVCGVSLRNVASLSDPYARAILLQGLAAMVELLSEPLYILAQARLALQLRVAAEAAATLCRGALTLALLKAGRLDVGIALSLAQLAYAAVTLAVYAAYFAHGFLAWAGRGGASGGEAGAVAGEGPARQISAQHAVLHPADDQQLTEPLEGTALLPVPEPLGAAAAGAGLCTQEDEDGRQLGYAPAGASGSKEGAANAGSQEELDGWEVLARGGTAGAPAEQEQTAQSRGCQEAGAGGIKDRAQPAGTSAAEPAAGAALHEGLRRRRAGGAASASGGADSSGVAAAAVDAGKPSAPGTQQQGSSEVLRLCGHFTLQAAEKLVLAEGSKLVMVALQSAYSQGVYGLVTNLGSLVVRTLFQPFEEAAYLAFSQPADRKLSQREAAAKRLRVLSIAVRSATLIGGLAVAFGPANCYLLLHIVYGQRWSETQAPLALAAYCPYILLLAVNGILEAYVHAVAEPRVIKAQNGYLVVCSVVHLIAAVVLVRLWGTIGLILADCGNMCIRICICLDFLKKHFCSVPTYSQRKLMPNKWTGLSLCAACLVTLASDAICLGSAGAPEWFLLSKPSTNGTFSRGFWVGAAVHVFVGAACLGGVLCSIWRTERSLLDEIRLLRGQGS